MATIYTKTKKTEFIDAIEAEVTEQWRKTCGGFMLNTDEIYNVSSDPTRLILFP